MSQSALGLLMKRLDLRGPLLEIPPDDADYYGKVGHFAARGGGYRVAPPHPKPPEPGFEGRDRWQWLNEFGQRRPPGARRPNFPSLLNGFASGLHSGDHRPLTGGAYRVACALEFLSGLRHLQNPLAHSRLLEVAAVQKSAAGTTRPDTEFVYDTWRGLYLLMEQCMTAAGVDWHQVPSDCFPALTRPGHSADASLLSSWPEGYEHWVRTVHAMDDGDPAQLRLDPRTDPVWSQAVRLWAPARRSSIPSDEVPRATPGVRPQPGAAAGTDWFAALTAWVSAAPTDDDPCPPILSARPRDGLLSRRSSTIGSFVNLGGTGSDMRHASPLALLIAAIAADRYIASDRNSFEALSKSMSQPNPPAAELHWPDYDSVWINTALRVRDIVPKMPRRSADAAAKAAAKTPDADRFAPYAAARTRTPSFETAPVTATQVSWDADDDGIVLVRLPLAALGPDAPTHLQRWAQTAVPCFVDVHLRLQDRSEPWCLASTSENWLDDGMLNLALRPRVPHDSRLQSFWSGQLSVDRVRLKCWLVDGADAGAPHFPVLYLRIELLA